MKRIISNVMLVAVAVAAFFSCQKQEMNAPEISQELMLTFASEKPTFSDETKTEWTGTDLQWSAGDKISIAYTVDGTWQNASGDASNNAKLYKSEVLGAACENAKFNVSTYFTGTTAGTHVFYGVYPAPGSTDFNYAPVATLSVSPNQNPKVSSFDSNADLMIGVSGEYSSRPGEGETISLKWDRLVAHAVITLKNINGLTDNEAIEYITLTAQDAANLVGQQKVNLITKEVVKDNSEANVLKLAADKLEVNDATVSFWASFLPETITSLTVEVETNVATYTRNITGISKEFKKNARNLLSVKMNEAIRVEKAADPYTVDVLTKELTGIDGTSYDSWSGKTSLSTAVYAGQSAGGNESIQLRSSNSNSGVITTTSGGYAKKIAVKWHSSTSSGRTLNIYGSHTAYTSPTELYGNNLVGELIGTIVCGTSTEIEISGDYEFIGMRANSGAMYLEEIKISWLPAAADTTPRLEVAKAELELGAETAEGTVAVIAKNLEAVEVKALVAEGSQEEATWLEVSYTDGVLSYSAEANSSEEQRTAYIELYALDAEANAFTAGIRVAQKGKVVVDADFEPGQYWIMGTEDDVTRVMTPLGATANYGYGPSEVVTDGRSFAKNAFTFTAVEGGYTIQDASGRYYYADDTHKSFQLGTDSSAAGLVWTVCVQNDGTYLLTNVASSRIMKYGDGTYTTFGVYLESDSATGVHPVLVKADNPLVVELSSISVSGNKTSFTEGDAFEFGGTVTANYTDGTTKDVTASASVSTPEMTDGATVTVSYTEGDVTKTFLYNITIKAEGGDEAQPITVSNTIANIADANNWSNSIQYSNIKLDDVITVKATGKSNTGKYYTSGENWRIYQNESPSLEISASDGYTIKTVTIKYSIEKTGILTLNGSNITSETEVTVNAASITFGVGNTSNVTNGQVRVTDIKVVYQKN